MAAAARVVVAPLGNGPAVDADASQPECNHQPQPEESRESEDIIQLPPVHGIGPRSASASGPLVTFTICGMTGCEASCKLLFGFSIWVGGISISFTGIYSVSDLINFQVGVGIALQPSTISLTLTVTQ